MTDAKLTIAAVIEASPIFASLDSAEKGAQAVRRVGPFIDETFGQDPGTDGAVV